MNPFQQAVAAVGNYLVRSRQFVTMIVGYGFGKSRCYFAVMFSLAFTKKAKVQVVFANQGLLSKD